METPTWVTAPSMVFAGLITGASGRRPTLEPTRYAAVSPSQVTQMSSSTHSFPNGRSRSQKP